MSEELIAVGLESTVDDALMTFFRQSIDFPDLQMESVIRTGTRFGSGAKKIPRSMPRGKPEDWFVSKVQKNLHVATMKEFYYTTNKKVIIGKVLYDGQEIPVIFHNAQGTPTTLLHTELENRDSRYHHVKLPEPVEIKCRPYKHTFVTTVTPRPDGKQRVDRRHRIVYE